MRLLILCGLIAPVLRVGLIITLGFLHPTYSQAIDFISELGAPDSPYAEVMNYVGISVVGALLAGFSVALGRSATDRPGRIGAGLLFLSGIAFVAVGFVPCDQPGCESGGSAGVMMAHVLSGFIGMSAQALAPVAYGLRLWRSREGALYSAASLVLGLVSIAGLVALVSGFAFPGLAQKTMQFAADAWVFLSAVRLYGQFESLSAIRPVADGPR